MSDLNLLVLSDIHAFNGDLLDEDAPSYYSIRPQYRGNAKDPFFSIPAVLEHERLPVDWVICPGDLADRADPASQAVAWEALERLRQGVGARLLVGAVGNHDVDSRLKYDGVDVKGALQSLVSPFPGLNESAMGFFGHGILLFMRKILFWR